MGNPDQAPINITRHGYKHLSEDCGPNVKESQEALLETRHNQCNDCYVQWFYEIAIVLWTEYFKQFDEDACKKDESIRQLNAQVEALKQENENLRLQNCKYKCDMANLRIAEKEQSVMKTQFEAIQEDFNNLEAEHTKLLEKGKTTNEEILNYQKTIEIILTEGTGEKACVVQNLKKYLVQSMDELRKTKAELKEVKNR